MFQGLLFFSLVIIIMHAFSLKDEEDVNEQSILSGYEDILVKIPYLHYGKSYFSLQFSILSVFSISLTGTPSPTNACQLINV